MYHKNTNARAERVNLNGVKGELPRLASPMAAVLAAAAMTLGLGHVFQVPGVQSLMSSLLSVCYSCWYKCRTQAYKPERYPHCDWKRRGRASEGQLPKQRRHGVVPINAFKFNGCT